MIAVTAAEVVGVATAVGYATTWLTAAIPAPATTASKFAKGSYRVLQWVSANVGYAKNHEDVIAQSIQVAQDIMTKNPKAGPDALVVLQSFETPKDTK